MLGLEVLVAVLVVTTTVAIAGYLIDKSVDRKQDR